jgi:hypothetical protein
MYEDLDEEFLNALNAPAPTRISSSDSDEERAPSSVEDDDGNIGDVLCPPDPPGPDPPTAGDWDPSAGSASDPPMGNVDGEGNTDEGIEIPYVDGDGASASSSIEGDRRVSSVDDDQVLEENEIHDSSDKPDEAIEAPHDVDGIIETPDDGASTPAAGEGDRSVSSIDDNDQEGEDDEGKFPDVLYSPAGMPLDTVMETQCDSSEKSSVDNDQDYYIGEEQMPNYGVLDMSDELKIAGNEREEREEGSPTSSKKRLSSSSSPDAQSSSNTEELAEERSSPTPSKTRSISSSASSRSSGKRKERKPDRIFDSAQKAILQAQEILQTLSLESSSSSSCTPDHASTDSSHGR